MGFCLHLNLIDNYEFNPDKHFIKKKKNFWYQTENNEIREMASHIGLCIIIYVIYTDSKSLNIITNIYLKTLMVM